MRLGLYQLSFAWISGPSPDTSGDVVPNPKVYLGIDSSLCYRGSAIVLSNLNTPASSDNTYHWNTGATTPAIRITSPGLYRLTQVAPNLDCTGVDQIEILKDCFVDMPNAFTPNGDGINDYFFPRGKQYNGSGIFSFQVFNRWGQLIYETRQKSGLGWDGKWNEQVQPAGVYIYRIEVVFKNGARESYEGNVTLIR